MITDPEWNIISKKAFPASSPAKAPPFLWTRILAAIEAEEGRRAGLWWMQWRWMSRITVVAGLVITLGTVYLFQHSLVPLDAALDGVSIQHQAIQIANADTDAADETALLVGADS